MGKTGISQIDGALRAALDALAGELCGRDWMQDGGAGAMRIGRCLIDSGWKSHVVYRMCRESAHGPIVMPSKGFGITAAKMPIGEWPKKQGEQRGLNWTVRRNESRVRACAFDSNFWKTFVWERLLTPVGAPSALGLFGDRAADHRMFADHLTSEFRIATEGRGRRVEQWELRPEKPDNHMFDVMVGCAVGASMQGCALADGPGGAGGVKIEKKQKVSFAAMQAAREAARKVG